MRSTRRLFALAFVGLVAFATSLPARAQQDPVTVFAAASLQDALKDIANKFTAETKLPVRFSFAASSALIKQVEQGAPADLFASADVDWMDYAQAHNLIQPQTRVDLLGNKLVVIAPADAAPASLSLTAESLLKAIGTSRLATGEVKSVPVGRYAKAALEKLGLWNDIEPHLAQTESVRAALVLVARGEAALGIVYLTDARVEPRVKIVAEFSADTHPPIIYPFAVTAGALGDGPARLIAFIRGPEARKVFESSGFTILAPPSPIN
jgi:molybdate transport system substrate-binding protein